MGTGVGGRSTGEEPGAGMVALADELGALLVRMKGAGPKIAQFLSMVQLEPAGADGRSAPLGALRGGRAAIPYARVRGVVERELGARVRDVFADFGEQPLAIASVGQVHRARTEDGEDVAVKVQHPGVAEAVGADLRGLGVVSPILGRLAPGLDASAILAELRERIADELDYEVEAQHQRRVGRLFRGHPHVVVPRVRTDLSTRRVLVSEYVEGRRFDAIARLGQAQRDRIGEVVFRFFFGLVSRHGVVAGDPHPDNCLLCPDGRLCLLDFGLVRDLEPDHLEGQRRVMRALTAGDSEAVRDALLAAGYLPDPRSFDPAALLEHLATAGEWILAGGARRLDPDYVTRILELGYPPRSPWFGLMRRQSLPAPTLLLRRMEVQVLALLGELRAQADWATLAREHWTGEPAPTALGREDRAFFERRAR